VTVPLSEFNNLFQIGGSYKLCHGNNYNVCSALVAVTGTTHCAGASSSASSAACTDSDGGKNYYVRGTITNYLPFGTTPFPYASDVCFKDNNQNPAIDPNILLEGYCGDDGYGHLEQYTCPYGCQDGVCLPSQSSSSLACTPAGQTHPVIPGASCCPGLTDIGTNKPNVDGSCPPPPLGVVLCAKCGNGECALGENYCNCPADCKKPCAGEGEKVYGSPQFGPTHCCSKNAGIKPSTFLVGDTCVAPNDGSLGTCVDNWWRTCGDGTCGTGEDKCNCPADCRCPSPTPPLCQNGILVPQLGPDENGCKLPPVCCEGANAPQAQCQLNLSCGSGTCRITSCTCS
jgi:hypothetical protein